MTVFRKTNTNFTSRPGGREVKKEFSAPVLAIDVPHLVSSGTNRCLVRRAQLLHLRQSKSWKNLKSKLDKK